MGHGSGVSRSISQLLEEAIYSCIYVARLSSRLVITAVSPNVVVTVMLKLKEDRLGLNSGIHTLIYAMTTCNDVVAIFMFGVVISMIFSTGT